MIAPLYQIAMASSAVVALVGTRVYPFGHVDGQPAKPYVVWQGAAGRPENYLGDLPDVDHLTTQVDVYAASAASALATAKALRDAFEPVAYVVSWRGESRDPETKNYRFGFDVAWIVQR